MDSFPEDFSIAALRHCQQEVSVRKEQEQAELLKTCRRYIYETYTEALENEADFAYIELYDTLTFISKSKIVLELCNRFPGCIQYDTDGAGFLNLENYQEPYVTNKYRIYLKIK